MMLSTAWCILGLSPVSALLGTAVPQMFRGAGAAAPQKQGLGIPGTGDRKRPDQQEDGYIPSIYDAEAQKYFSGRETPRGYALDHTSPSGIKRFGNISLLSLNAHVERDTLDELQKSTVTELIDTHHPTVFGLQSVSKDVIDHVLENTREHYSVASGTQKVVDIRTTREEYKPIFYDTKVLTRVAEGVFEPKDEKDKSYASFAVFKRTDSADYFTVVNGDLYSTEKTAIDTFVFNIAVDLRKSYFRDFPVFYLGTINTVSHKLENLIGGGVNLIEKDTNNGNTSRNTFHSHDNFDDGVQRDFILLFDTKKRFELNYSRILHRFDTRSFAHYPVFAILTLKPPQSN